MDRSRRPPPSCASQLICKQKKKNDLCCCCCCCCFLVPSSAKQMATLVDGHCGRSSSSAKQPKTTTTTTTTVTTANYYWQRITFCAAGSKKKQQQNSKIELAGACFSLPKWPRFLFPCFFFVFCCCCCCCCFAAQVTISLRNATMSFPMWCLYGDFTFWSNQCSIGFRFQETSGDFEWERFFYAVIENLVSIDHFSTFYVTFLCRSGMKRRCFFFGSCSAAISLRGPVANLKK